MDNYENLVQSFLEDYMREYGRRHFEKIINKVDKSNSVKSYLIKIQDIKMPPLCDDLIATIMSMPYFMVARKETIAAASILLLQKWHETFNQDYRLLGDGELKSLFQQILLSSGEMI